MRRANVRLFKKTPKYSGTAGQGGLASCFAGRHTYHFRDATSQALIMTALGPGSSSSVPLGLGPLWDPPAWSVDGNYILGNERGQMKLIILRLGDRKRQEVRIWDEDLNAQCYALVRLRGGK